MVTDCDVKPVSSVDQRVFDAAPAGFRSLSWEIKYESMFEILLQWELAALPRVSQICDTIILKM